MPVFTSKKNIVIKSFFSSIPSNTIKSIGLPKGALLPEYLSAKYLQPFISNELREKFEGAILYVSKGSHKSMVEFIGAVYRNLGHSDYHSNKAIAAIHGMSPIKELDLTLVKHPSK